MRKPKKKSVEDEPQLEGEDPQPEEVVVVAPAVPAKVVVEEVPQPVVAAPVTIAPNTNEHGHGGVYRSTGDGRRVRLR